MHSWLRSYIFRSTTSFVIQDRKLKFLGSLRKRILWILTKFQLNQTEVAWNSCSNRCWKFLLSILKNKNKIFLKIMVYAVVSTYNSYLTLIFWNKCIDLRPFFEIFCWGINEAFEVKAWGWILRIWPRKKNSLTKKPSTNLWNVRQPSIGQTIADMNCFENNLKSTHLFQRLMWGMNCI